MTPADIPAASPEAPCRTVPWHLQVTGHPLLLPDRRQRWPPESAPEARFLWWAFGTRIDMIRTIDLLRQWMLHPPLSSPPVTTLIRLMVGAVFLWEAIMKFVFPDTLGPGRFSLIGLPAPDVMSPFDAAFEAGCGILLMLGLLTRLAAIPMIIDMVVAIF